MCSFKTNSVSFRTFRCPLFPKPVSWLELFCRFLQQTGSTFQFFSHQNCFLFFRCGCDECMTSRSEDSLRHSRSRINAYRALASPSLIALSSKDPILTAFELSWELRRLSFAEHEFKSEYLVSAFCCSKTIKSSFSPKI